MTARRPAHSPRPCKHCGEPFTPPVVPGPTPQCCSDECRIASRNERRRLVWSRQPRGAKRVSAVCGVCGVRFTYVQQARARKYCSTACKGLAAKWLQRKRPAPARAPAPGPAAPRKDRPFDGMPALERARAVARATTPSSTLWLYDEAGRRVLPLRHGGMDR